MIVSLNIVMFIVFSVYAATGGVLTPKKVFTTLSLLIVLRLTTVHFLVQNFLAFAEGRVATIRLQVSTCMTCYVLSIVTFYSVVLIA